MLAPNLDIACTILTKFAIWVGTQFRQRHNNEFYEETRNELLLDRPMPKGARAQTTQSQGRAKGPAVSQRPH